MGFNLSSFAGGFATAFTEDIEKEEKLAEVRGISGVKNMADTYKTVMVENRKLKSDLVENVNTLQQYDPTATDQELFEIAKSKPLMDIIAAKVKDGDFKDGGFKLSDYARVVKDNSTATALERVEEMFKLPKVEAAAPTEIKKTGNVIRDITATAGSKAGERAARETAAALGVTLEDLRAAKAFKTPDLTSAATVNMEAIEKPKTFDQQENAAKVRLLDAQRAGDPDKVKEAQADLLIVNNIKQSLTTEQTQFSNKVADIKNRYMFGTPEERKAAKPEYDKLMADIRAEALAKKVTKDGEGEGKIPALGTLNTFTSAAVARAVAAKHGDLIKSKHLAIIENPDGSVGIDYIGDNETLRRQILETQANAAKNALSLYTDAEGKPLNRDVASVMNSFTAVVPSVVRTDTPAAAPAAAGPTRPAVPTPAASLRREAEAAIARGANRDAVAKRFKEQTGQEF